jgi:hypothetical protein
MRTGTMVMTEEREKELLAYARMLEQDGCPCDEAARLYECLDSISEMRAEIARLKAGVESWKAEEQIWRAEIARLRAINEAADAVIRIAQGSSLELAAKYGDQFDYGTLINNAMAKYQAALDAGEERP